MNTETPTMQTLSTRARAARRRVLLALPPKSLSTVALLRAQALARLWRAELHVVRVVPIASTSFPLFPHFNSLAALESVASRFDGLETTAAWLTEVLGSAFEATSLELRVGDFVDETSGHALELGAELVVVPAAEGPIGDLVTSLARAARAPVLVARAPTSGEAIVAASDLNDHTYPVLTRAAELGVQLEAPVVATHNVPPMTWATDPVEPRHVTLSATEALTAARYERLRKVAATLGDHTEAAMLHASSSTQAVLELARQRDADLLVVGTRDWSLSGKLTGGNFAATIVQNSRRSVLVVPIESGT